MRRAFTLIEALMASSILLVVVLSVTSAVTSAQAHAYEARQQIAGTIAAEELMGRLVAVDYADLPDWHLYEEETGALSYDSGDPFPASFNAVGRQISVTSTDQSLSGLGVLVRGYTIKVRSFDTAGFVLAEMERFVPEPPSS